MTDEIQIRIVPRFVAGGRNTDILIRYRGRDYYTRKNEVVAPTPASYEMERRAFLARRIS